MVESENEGSEKVLKRPEVKWSSFIIPTLVAIILRAIVYVYFCDYLEDNVLFVAPWNSFQQLKDAVTIWKNGLSLYAGGYHSMPWIAFMFTPLLNYNYLLLAIFTALDLLAAFFTFKFTLEFLANKSDNPSEHAATVYKIYVLNPLGVGICAAFSVSSFVNLLLTAALYFNYKKKTPVTITLISLIAQLNIYYIVLLFAVDYSESKNDDKCCKKIAASFLFASLLYASNGLFVNLLEVFDGNIMFFMRVEDHTPNVGNFWYMFTQVFPQYQLFFLFVFQLLAFVYVIPFWRIMRDHPFTLWFVYLQIVSIVSSYPTYAEFCIYLPLFFTFIMYQKYYKLTCLIAMALVISFGTFMITLTQWLQTGSYSANFFFGSCTTYMLSIVGLAYETINAHLIDQDVKWSGVIDPAANRFYLNVPAIKKIE